jgi:hypothetical protein
MHRDPIEMLKLGVYEKHMNDPNYNFTKAEWKLLKTPKSGYKGPEVNGTAPPPPMTQGGNQAPHPSVSPEENKAYVDKVLKEEAEKEKQAAVPQPTPAPGAPRLDDGVVKAATVDPAQAAATPV